jgi:hypothetical protein
MLLPLALFALAPQAAPAQNAQSDEIVVKATLGRTTMLFDKGSDGRLRNCRVMVSSGSQRRDVAACQATPVCYAKTAGTVTDCIDLVVLETPLNVAPGPAKPLVFEAPKLVQPLPPVSPKAIGPVGIGEDSKETERQRVKLPPLPQAPKNDPVVRVTMGNER